MGGAYGLLCSACIDRMHEVSDSIHTESVSGSLQLAMIPFWLNEVPLVTAHDIITCVKIPNAGSYSEHLIININIHVDLKTACMRTYTRCHPNV